jgi:hypothetical protein
MISIECDKCEQAFEVGEERGGTKANCPHCGDVNRVPTLAELSARAAAKAGAAASAAAGAVPAAQAVGVVAGAKHDRAVAAGYPPDSGPEQRVLMVRRAMVRSRPLRFFGTLLVLIGSVVMAGLFLSSVVAGWAAIVCGVLGLAALGLIGWWWVERFGAALEITNKRTVQHKGFFSRASSEVLHDNIRNVQVTQSFWERLWRVGQLGLSSSGQDGVEIQADNLPDPEALRKVIDLYRPL